LEVINGKWGLLLELPASESLDLTRPDFTTIVDALNDVAVAGEDADPVWMEDMLWPG